MSYTDPGIQPIYPSYPPATTGFQNKYTDPTLRALLQSIPKPTAAALIQYDLGRMQQGQQPISMRQTALALQSAITNKATTPLPHQGFFGRLGSDFRQLLATVPRLPVALFHEVQELPNAPRLITEALGESSPSKVISSLSNVPGVRLLPGAFTAGQVAREGVSGLVEHPLFTALDVFPYAKAPLGKLASPITSKLAGSEAVRALGATRGGQFLKQMASKQSRDVAQIVSHADTNLRRWMDPNGVITPGSPAEVELIRQANTLKARYNIPDEEVEALSQLGQLDPAAILNLPADRQAMFAEQRQIVEDMAYVQANQGRLVSIDNEWYSRDQAQPLLAATAMESRVRSIANTREAVLTPTSGVVHDSIRTDLLRNDALTLKSKRVIAQGFYWALDRAGFNVTSLKPYLRINKTKGSMVAIADVMDNYIADARAGLINKPPVDMPAIMADLTRRARTDTKVAVLLDHVRRENFGDARTVAGQLFRDRKVHVIPGIDDLINHLQSSKESTAWLSRTAAFDTKAADRLLARATKLHDETAPARFHPIIEQRVHERVVKDYEYTYSHEPEWPRMLAILNDRMYPMLRDWSPAILRDFEKEITSTWKLMREELAAKGSPGPIFVHRVSPDAVPQINFPHVIDAIRNESQVATRTMSATPYVEDMFIGLSHQGLEIVQRLGSEMMIDEMVGLVGRTQAQLMEEYWAAGQRAHARNPHLSVKAHVQGLIAREYDHYVPTAYIPWSRSKLPSHSTGAELYIPKTVSKNFAMMKVPMNQGFGAFMDPVMKLFRTSLLPFSPRWHAYNLLGGGVMTFGETGPGAVKLMGQAWQMARHKGLEQIEGAPPSGMISVSDDLIEWQSKAGFGDHVMAAYHYMGGKTMARVMDEATASRMSRFLSRAGKVFDASTKKLYGANGFIDDFYRSLAYLHGHDKALTKGLTEEAARHTGIELVRKIMQNWDRQTPIERTIMRRVFPFYGWMSHVLKYVYRYPIDHPTRVAILGSFARNEVADMGDALPERFLNTFFLGKPDASGMVRSINLQGLNPFSDVANYFTIAGFTGNINPIISAVFQTIGIDPGRGTQELYPELRYDAVSGRLVAKHDNFITNLIGSVIPQSKVLLGLTQSSSDFKQVLRTNPEAAASILRSQLGLPVIFRSYNVPQEIFKAEIQRDLDVTDVRNSALKSGDYSAAISTYPHLASYFEQVRQLQATGQLTAYTPDPSLSPNQSMLAIAQRALLQMNVP